VLLRIADLSFFTPKRSRSSIFLASAALSPLQHIEVHLSTKIICNAPNSLDNLATTNILH
ncbi:MAG: hypothetical protein V7L13_13215, partial [Nostoc sp.]|uniref:hypothetical protein n=1 Tax=Nostoc sp. TaxID=1180 RepID=UPI002FFAB32E